MYQSILVLLCCRWLVAPSPFQCYGFCFSLWFENLFYLHVSMQNRIVRGSSGLPIWLHCHVQWNRKHPRLLHLSTKYITWLKEHICKDLGITVITTVLAESEEKEYIKLQFSFDAEFGNPSWKKLFMCKLRFEICEDIKWWRCGKDTMRQCILGMGVVHHVLEIRHSAPGVALTFEKLRIASAQHGKNCVSSPAAKATISTDLPKIDKHENTNV